MVRTPGFHPGNRGSIPRRATKASNKYQHKTARNSVRKLKSTTSKKEAKGLFPKVVGMLDKLAKKNIIHKNKAANIKSQIAKHVNTLK